MRIDEQHIGKKVRNTQGKDVFTVLAVGPSYFFGLRHDGCEDVYRRSPLDGDWEIVEPRPKPSERIQEIFNTNGDSGLLTRETFPVTKAILDFLDEEAAKVKP